MQHGDVGVAQAIVLFEVVGRQRGAAGVQVGRAGADDAADGGEFAGDEAGILQRADADGDIDAFFDQVHEAVAHAEIDGEFRVKGQEIRQSGGEMEEAEAHRRIHPQAAARGGLQLGDGEVGFLEIGEDAGGAFEIAAPGFGEGE